MLIDTFQSGWQERLATFEAIMLVDGVFLPGFHGEVAGLLSASNRVFLLFEVLPSCDEETRDISPFLFRHEPGNAALAAALEKCSGWPMVSAIKTSEPPARLAERLATWCIVENDNERFNFRFPDTRRLPGIFRVLHADQRRQFAGPAEAWIYIERDGSWGALPVSQGSVIDACAPALDDDQFGKLVQDSEVDAMIQQLAYHGRVLSMPSSQKATMVAAMIGAADAMKLDPDTRLNWCIDCVGQGASVDRSSAPALLEQWLKSGSHLGDGK